MSGHLDLDDLCDVLAGEAGGAARGHLDVCPACTRALQDVEQAQEPVRAALAALPAPEVPGDLAARLDAALLRAHEQELGAPTPLRRSPGPLPSASRAPAWLLTSAAAVAVVAAVGAGLARLPRRTESGDTAASASSALTAPRPAGAPALAASSTGTDYGAGASALVTALPALLYGSAFAGDSAQEAADPLARLHSRAGLEACLAGLADDGAPQAPLAVDYARFAGAPALVVVLPGARPDLLDVYVVGADCDAQDGHTLLFAELPRAS